LPEQIEVQDNASLVERPPQERRRTWREARRDVYAIVALADYILRAEQRLYGNVQEQFHQLQEQMAEGPAVTVLGPDALAELGMKMGRVVQALERRTVQQRRQNDLAEKGLMPPPDMDREEVTDADYRQAIDWDAGAMPDAGTFVLDEVEDDEDY
jgi:hypothetical protein